MIPSTRSLKNPAPARLRMPRRETAPEIFDQFRDRLSESLANDLPPIDELSTNAGYDRLLGYCDAKFITASNSSFSYKAKRQGKSRTRARIESYMRCYRAPLEDDWTPNTRCSREPDGGLSSNWRDAQFEWDRIIKEIRRDLITVERLRKYKNTLRKELHKETKKNLARLANNAQTEDFKRILRAEPIKHMFYPYSVTNPPLLQCIAANASGTYLRVKAYLQDHQRTLVRTHATADGGRIPQPSNVGSQLRGPDDPATLVASTPAGRLETWTFYFETLRHRDTPPAVEQKPWLNCAAAADYKAKLRGVGAFIWPQDFTLEHLRITLRRGNPQPFALGNKDDLPGVVDLTINGVRRRVPVTNKPRMLRTAFLD